MHCVRHTMMTPKILSVDDNPANLVSVRRLLTRIDGLEIIEARNGNEALAATLDHEFALILLDVHMPDMDGFEVASLLAQEERTRETPVIFVTATYADELHQTRGYRSGAVDYITKPLDERILLSKVQVFLELHRQRRELRQVQEQLEHCAQQSEREMRERQRSESESMHLACHDPLTGLTNRRLFMERGEAAMQDESANAAGVALIVIDVDRFADINTSHGHRVGDRILVVLAKRLAGLVAADDILARIGGNEFAIIVAGDRDLPALAVHVAERLRQPIDIGGASGLAEAAVSLRISTGIAHAAAAAAETSFDRLLVMAHHALRESRHADHGVAAAQAASATRSISSPDA